MRTAPPPSPCCGRLAGGVLAAVVVQAALSAAAWAEPASSPAGIYTCVDDRGRRLTSDRPITECRAKEQRVLNRDGSLKAVVPPTLTAEERVEKEMRERKAAEQRAARADAARRDRNMLARFPDEAAHSRAREAALDTVRVAIRASALRMNALELERKPLMNEAEFYAGRQMPGLLRSQIDANDAAMDAQRSAMLTAENELVRINRLYDAELKHLRQLWAGAPPGSLGPVASAPADPKSAP